MSNFLKRLVQFSFLIAIILTINYVFNIVIIEGSKIDLGETEILANGDSHIKYGLNPDSLKKCTNISNPGKTYFEIYHELKNVLPQNESIKIVITSLSQENLLASQDRRVSSGVLLDSLYSLIDWQDLKGVGIDKSLYLQTIIQEMMLYPKLSHGKKFTNMFLKDTSVVTKYQLDGLASYGQRRFYVNDTLVGNAVLEVGYLDSIIEFTHKMKVQLILVSMPVSKGYYEIIPSKFLSDCNSIREEYKRKGVIVIDYSVEKLDNKFFRDPLHLNYAGACLISKNINDHVELILMGEN